MSTAERPVNTHLLHQAFEYVRPGSLEEAIAVLDRHREAARLLAGGTNLIVDMKLERCAPSLVIDIGGLKGLSGIREEDGWIRIGSLTPIRSLATSPLLWGRATALAEAAFAFGSTQIAMMGTIGGNICNGSPASDTVPALVALEAEGILAGPDGERTVAIGDLLDAPGKTRLRPGEILVEVRLAPTMEGTGSAFLKLSRVRADLSKASVAVRLTRDGETIRSARVELGSVGPTVTRARATESALGGLNLGELGLDGGGLVHDALLDAARFVAEEIEPIDDVRSTAGYRRRVAAALVYDAATLAWGRSRGRLPDPPRGGAGPSPKERAPLDLGSDDRTRIRLRVNGTMHELEVRSHDLLLNVLREHLGLTGSKYGCGIGECGACTIWIDGEVALGCLILAVRAAGADIRTVEGLAAPDGTLDPLQEAFIEENAFQCGYCTPGMLMMTKRLLAEIPDPTEDEVRDHLKGNRCRCTGYASIWRAVRRASDDGRSREGTT